MLTNPTGGTPVPPSSQQHCIEFISPQGREMLRSLRFAATFIFAASLHAETEAELAARGAALHARIFTIDTHLDTPTYSLLWPDWEISQRHEMRADGSFIDLPRMREGGLKAAVFAVYLEQGPLTPAGHAAVRDRALRAFVRVHEMTARHVNDCALALSADDGVRIAADGRRAIFVSIENGYAIGRDLTLLKTYHELGARFFGVVHNGNNDLADSSQPDRVKPRNPDWNGLSPLGREVVAECNRLGLVLDGSHASDETVRQLLELSRTPVMLTHSACRAIFDHPRNVGDDLLRAIARQGGVVQLNTVSEFFRKLPTDPAYNAARQENTAKWTGRISDADVAQASRERARLRWKFPDRNATLDHYIEHILHAVKLMGADHVGIGSDMDGGGGLVGLEDVSDYPKITLALLKRGLSEEDIVKIWGGNTLRVLRAAEEFARKL
jgi:membrane dipeptidase